MVKRLLWLFLACTVASGSLDAAEPPLPRPQGVDFIREIEPIFKSECYQCHSEKKPKGNLRLDARTLAMKGGSSGAAITPGKAADSYLVHRIEGTGGEDRMPLDRPALSPQQIALIRRWIDGGANWPDAAANTSARLEAHWAFVKPRPMAPAIVHNPAWPKNPIDTFILARLEKEGLQPSPEADRPTLLRRLSLDLIGLPPTPAEVDAFVKDASPNAYDKQVDRLLASPHFGEKWARHWLDLARYADTNGYEKDRTRVIWPYRDWVIAAFNSNMPFDKFTVEQIAGDMLPNAGVSQRVATGFHRNAMTNEEGGIDVEEFRFKAVVDRVQTTMTTWMGVTFQCAQCHTHKYDPFSQKEYYQLFAMLNNANEADFYEVPDEKIAASRAEAEKKIAEAITGLPKHFPTHKPDIQVTALHPTTATATAAQLTVLDDGSIIASGPRSATDTYTITTTVDAPGIQTVRLEVLTDPSFPHGGPGRTGGESNGNFVLTDFKVLIVTPDGKTSPVALSQPQADVNQTGFTIAAAIDADPKTGWAVDDGAHRNQNHWATFAAAVPAGTTGRITLKFILDQQFPDHTIGRFKLLVGGDRAIPPANVPPDELRQRYLAQRFDEWEKESTPKAGNWTILQTISAVSRNAAVLELQPDGAVLAKFDKPNTDVYDLEFDTLPPTTTALRLEVLPDPSLPENGPGRAPLFSPGDFLLSEFQAFINSPAKPKDWRPVKFASASHSYAAPKYSAAAALDGKLDTGWSVAGKIGEAHRAVFASASPLKLEPGARLRLSLVQNGIHQMTLGRFRLWATTDAQPRPASALAPEIEALLLIPTDKRSARQTAQLRTFFLSVAPELASQHKQIAEMRKALPKLDRTLVMEERDIRHARVTRIHHRGEFLQPKEAVKPAAPAVLHPLRVDPSHPEPNRLDLAHWLVDPENPLVGRVTMNRAWSVLFGRGIVNTLDDFGIQGERPTHPELLDYLATEFVARHWDFKAMLRLVVTSATYRQSSHVSPQLWQRDPQNILLARGPRVRVDGEAVRDIALCASGLLSPKIGGPSVFPPQPAGITELSYGPMPWKTSVGDERYRRGLYTFLKRTSPYPGLNIFDTPNGDVTCPKRPHSDTPLQALQTLNDAVFVEAAQAMARRLFAEGPKDAPGRIALAFRWCTARPPEPDELRNIGEFYSRQIERFKQKPADAAQLAAADPKQPATDVPDLAAWTAVSRVLLNLDETITKE